MNDELLGEVTDGVLTLTINREERRNAISAGMMAGMRAWFDRANEPGSEIRVIVLTGAGDKAFCAGADLQNDQSFKNSTAYPRAAYTDLFRAAHHVYQPIVARVNGVCLGGGMGLLAMCDLAIADAGARFGLPEVKVGVFPMMLMCVMDGLLLPRHMRELALTGDMIDAARARDIGLVNSVAEPGGLDAAVKALTDTLRERSPTAIRRGKYAMAAIESMSFEQSAAFLEGQLTLLAQTEDAQEGVAAFREKRAPNWTGN